MTARNIDLARGLLDHQIVDVDGRRCGKVDDLELRAEPGEPAVVTAILVGAPYWRDRIRGPIGRLLARTGGGHRIPCERVATVRSAVELDCAATELRLGRGDDRARKWIERIPGSK